MAPLTARALYEDIMNTVIEDSEPEREAEQKAERKKWKAERKKRKEETKRKEGDGVILVSDSEPTAHPTATQLGHGEPTASEINDTTIIKVPLPHPPFTHQAPNSSPSSDDEVQNLLACPSPHKEPNRDSSILDNAQDAPINLTACITSYSEPESLAPKIDLARFAFGRKPGLSIKQKLGLTIPKPISDATTSEEATQAFKMSKAATHLPSFANSFTTSQLAALSRCVVCDLPWTARKTVPVKMIHVKSCARKNGWHEATIIARLTTEIGHVPATIGSDAAKEPRNKKSRGKTTVEEAPKTYLEDVVNESGPKKKKRKGQGAELVTVLNPQEAHVGILERAKTLFGTGGPASTGHAQDVAAFPSTQQFRPSKLGSSGGPDTYVSVLGMGMLEDQTAPATAQATPGSKPGVGHVPRGSGDADLHSSIHPFRPSVLGERLAKRSIFERDESGNNALLGGDTSPTKTWEKNGPGDGFINRSVLGSAPDIRAMFSPRQPLTNPAARSSNPPMSYAKPLLTAIRHCPVENHGAPSTLYSASDELYLPKTLQKRLADFDRRLAEIRAPGHLRVQNADLYPIAHTGFEKIDKARQQARRDQGYRAESGGNSKGKQKAQSSSSSSSRSTSKSRSRSRSRKSPRRRKSRSPGKYHQVVPGTRPDKYCNENFDEDMHRIIKADMELYMRILRYEPIHFDVFLKAAVAQGMAGGWLRIELRAFLDRQAINFYGDNALASDRRRYK